VLTNTKSNEIKTGTNLLCTPEEHFIINLQNLNGTVTNYKFIHSKNKLIKTSGLILLKEKEGTLQKIIFQPGYEIKLQEKEKSINWQINSKIIYPGENLLNRIQISKVKYIQIFYRKSKPKNTFHAFIRPVNQWVISKPKKHLKEFTKIGIKHNLFILKSKAILNLNNGNWVNSSKKKPYQIITHILKIQRLITEQNKYKISFLNPSNTNYFFSPFIISSRIGQILNDNNLKINFHILYNQFLEPYTIISYFRYIQKKNEYVEYFKNRSSDKNKIFITTNNHYRSFGINETTTIVKRKRFVTKKDYLTKQKIINTAGYIVNIKEKKVKVRLGQPYFFSKGSLIYVEKGTYVTEKKNNWIINL
jgi:hypothetical protein